jgi:hypothetical protein
MRITMRAGWFLALLAAFVLHAGISQAAFEYSYVGNNFDEFINSEVVPGMYDASDSVTGSFTTAAALPPNLPLTNISAGVVDFSFSDGRQTIDSSSALTTVQISVATDANGDISDWTLLFQDGADATMQFDSWGRIESRSSGQVFDRGSIFVCVLPTPPFICGPGAPSPALDRGLVRFDPGTWSSAQLVEVVDIDIKPNETGATTKINLKKSGLTPVAILGSETFNVEDVDRTTLAFGPNGAAPVHIVLGHLEDVNLDGFMDLVSHYHTRQTGLQPGDTQACVTGEKLDDTPFEGCAAVHIQQPGKGGGRRD